MNTCPECFELLDGFGQCLKCGERVHLGSASQEGVEAADQESQKQNGCVHCGADAAFIMSVAGAERKLATAENPPKTFVRPNLIKTGDSAGRSHLPVTAIAGIVALGIISRGEGGSVVVGLLIGCFAVAFGISGSKQNSEYEANVRNRTNFMQQMEQLQKSSICIACEKLQLPSGETQKEFWERNASSQLGIARLGSGAIALFSFSVYRNFGTWREWYE